MTDEKKEGFTYETRDDGITEVDWEGEVYQPSEFEARDVAAGARLRERRIREIN